MEVQPLPLNTTAAAIWLNTVNNLLYGEGVTDPVSFNDGGLEFSYTTGCCALMGAEDVLGRPIQRFDQPRLNPAYYRQPIEETPPAPPTNHPLVDAAQYAIRRIEETDFRWDIAPTYFDDVIERLRYALQTATS